MVICRELPGFFFKNRCKNHTGGKPQRVDYTPEIKIHQICERCGVPYQREPTNEERRRIEKEIDDLYSEEEL